MAWIGDVTSVLDEPYKVLLHLKPACSGNQFCYTDEEMKLAARSLATKPLFLNHFEEPFGMWIHADWVPGEREVQGVGVLKGPEAQHFWNEIKLNGKAMVSQKTHFFGTDTIGGKTYPRGIVFDEVSLIVNEADPGKPDDYVEVLESWRAVYETRRETMEKPKQEGKPTLEENLPTQVQTSSNRVWTRAYIDALPDSSFAKIDPGGTKDGAGLTTPRTHRHYPYKDAGGTIDLPHLRSQLMLATQANDSDAMATMDAEKKKHKMGRYAESDEDKISWLREESIDSAFGVVEETLHRLETTVEASQTAFKAGVREALESEFSRSKYGEFLHTFGPEILTMRQKMETLVNRKSEACSCAGKHNQLSANDILSALEAKAKRALAKGPAGWMPHTVGSHAAKELARQHAENVLRELGLVS